MQPEGAGEEQPQCDSRNGQKGQVEKGNFDRLTVHYGWFYRLPLSR